MCDMLKPTRLTALESSIQVSPGQVGWLLGIGTLRNALIPLDAAAMVQTASGHQDCVNHRFARSTRSPCCSIEDCWLEDGMIVP